MSRFCTVLHTSSDCMLQVFGACCMVCELVRTTQSAMTSLRHVCSALQPDRGWMPTLELAAVNVACSERALNAAADGQGMPSWPCNSAFVSLLTREVSSWCSDMHAAACEHRCWLALLWLVPLCQGDSHAGANQPEKLHHWHVTHVSSLP